MDRDILFADHSEPFYIFPMPSPSQRPQKIAKPKTHPINSLKNYSNKRKFSKSKSDGREANRILAGSGASGHAAALASDHAPGEQTPHRLHGRGYRSNEGMGDDTERWVRRRRMELLEAGAIAVLGYRSGWIVGECVRACAGTMNVASAAKVLGLLCIFNYVLWYPWHGGMKF